MCVFSLQFGHSAVYSSPAALKRSDSLVSEASGNHFIVNQTLFPESMWPF